ncbi:MAG: hypothetical protein J5770_04910 [Bacteroidaceae bacterium]|nr:hypothetical protein [Bacteroidaceae bacterium]
MTKANTAKQRKTEMRNPAKQTKANQTPKLLMEGKWLPVIYAVLFAVFACYMLGIKNADYFYAAQEHSLFLYDKSFFDMLMVKPGALMTYLGCFFTQFFHEPVTGVCILIAIWLITYVLTIKAFKLSGWWSVLALLPIGALLCSETIIGYWLYYNKNQGYWFAPSIALMINMLAIWLYRCFKDLNKWAELGMIILWCVVGYWATGWLGLATTLVMGLTGITKAPKSRILPLLTAIICIVVIPLIAYQYYSQMRIDDAWWVGMPIFETENVDATRPWYPFIALIVILLVLGTLSFTAKKNILLKSKEAFLLIGLQLMCLIAIVGCELSADFDDYNYHAEFRIYRAIDENRWQDALDEVSALPNDPTREIIMLRDIALFHSGKIGDYMFKYNNMSIPPYVYDSLDVHMAQTNSPLVYLNYARLNFATRWSIENGVEHGFCIDNYKIMTRCALVAEEYELARKYINILKKTLYYKEWAERYEPILDNPKLLEKTPELSFIKEYYRHFHNMLDSDEGLVEMYLLNYFSNTMNKDSKQLQETTLFFAVQSKDIEKFWPRFFLYAHLHPGEPMPIHYQEAAYLYGNLEHQVDISTLPFDKDRIVNRYASFQQISNSYIQQGKSAEEVGELMKPAYGDTFWWFYFFCRGLSSY